MILFQCWTEWETLQDRHDEETLWGGDAFNSSSWGGKRKITGLLHHEGKRSLKTPSCYIHSLLKLNKVRFVPAVHTSTLNHCCVIFIRLHKRKRSSSGREMVWMLKSARWSWKIELWTTPFSCSTTVTQHFANPSTKQMKPVRMTR